jgi:hypothetical protein
MTEEMEAKNVHNDRGTSMAQRMINMVGVDSIHDSVRSSKLRATSFGMTNKFWCGHWRVGHASLALVEAGFRIAGPNIFTMLSK